MIFYVHDAAGRITHSASVADADGYRAMLVAAGDLFIEADVSANPRTHYVAAGALAGKTALDAPDAIQGIAGEELSLELPAGTRVYVDNVLQGETDGDPLEITFAVAATYRVSLDHPAHLWQEVTVEVVAP